MNNDEIQPEQAQPTRQQIGYARDAVVLAELLTAGQDDEAADLILNLMNDPASLPGVFRGMAGLIADALQVPVDVPPAVFFAFEREQLDGAEEQATGTE